MGQGFKVGKAISTIRKMHSDASMLLRDCGEIWLGRKSVFGNYATCDLTWKVNTEFWMAEAVYRYFAVDDAQPGLVEGLTICFCDKKRQFEEPILLVGQLMYRVPEGESAKSICSEWDIWDAFFWENRNPGLDEVLVRHDPSEGIEWQKVLGVDLYPTQSLKSVNDLVERVRAAPL